MSRKHLWWPACMAAALIAASTVQAQTFPAKPVHLISPFSAGSTVDIMARVIAGKLGEPLGQPVIVENRLGAGGAVGIEATVRAPKDGYTLLLSASGLAIIPGLNPKLSWDPVKDLAPIAQVANGPLVIIVHPGVPANNLKELIALARSKSGGLRYGHAGLGSTQHMAGQLFGVAASAEIVDVPYKGNEEAVTDLLAARLEINFQGIPTAVSQIRANKVRAIAVTSARRSVALPDVPTVGEAGLPGATVSVWYGLLAPAGTPRPVIERLNQAVLGVMKSPDVVETFTKGGSEVQTGTPDEFAKLIREEVATWARVIKQRGLKLE